VNQEGNTSVPNTQLDKDGEQSHDTCDDNGTSGEDAGRNKKNKEDMNRTPGQTLEKEKTIEKSPESLLVRFSILST